MSKTAIKQEPKIVGVQFQMEDLEPMEAFAEAHQLSLSWVIRKCVSIGLPIFLRNPVITNGSEADE